MHAFSHGRLRERSGRRSPWRSRAVRKVFIYSLLLVLGLVGSQFLAGRLSTPIQLLTMVALAFIMIHVGYEFEIDKSRPRQYVWDALVAFTAASFPWLFCAAY